MSPRPRVIALAGPNGAGKSTLAPWLLRGVLTVDEFVNADLIAQGLSAFRPEAAALAAGRVMRSRVGDLARRRSSFAFETTLAGRALWLQEIINTGYLFHLLFLWLPSADFALERVANRVAMGGHDVPEATIRRRYVRGLQNFFDVYQPMTATWRMYDNSAGALPRLVAAGRGHTVDRVLNQRTWDRIQQGAHAEG